MSRYSSKLIPIYLTAVILFPLIQGFCAQEDLSTLQKQARIYRDQGWQFQKQGNLDAALTLYQKALLMDPGFAAAYNDAGVILEARGQTDEAKQLYLKAIEMAADYPNSYSNLALLYESQGDYTNAILYWIKRAIRGSPQDPWGQVARRRLEDIERIYPQAYSVINNKFKENLRQLDIERSSLVESGSVQPEIKKSADVSLPGTGKPFSTDSQGPDIKTRAFDYLSRAEESFSRGEYVAALTDATQAEYLDSSSEEISAFVKKVREMLLQ